jgi:hypothetical protein
MMMDQEAAIRTDTQSATLHAATFPLRFLIDRKSLMAARLNGFSDSASFHRLHDLFWTLRDAPAIALLGEDEKAALEEFNAVFNILPWRVIESHPHISELPNDDLSPLIPAGERLCCLLEARVRQLQLPP